MIQPYIHLYNYLAIYIVDKYSAKFDCHTNDQKMHNPSYKEA